MFSFMSTRTNWWTNSGVTGDLRCHDAHLPSLWSCYKMVGPIYYHSHDLHISAGSPLCAAKMTILCMCKHNLSISNQVHQYDVCTCAISYKPPHWYFCFNHDFICSLKLTPNVVLPFFSVNFSMVSWICSYISMIFNNIHSVKRNNG